MAMISAIGQIAGGMAQSQAASYSAQVARNNSLIAQQNATFSEQGGAAKTEDEGLKNAARQGAIKAGLAANGVNVTSGSAVDVQAGQRETGAVDAARVMTNEELKAYGYRTQATNFDAQAGLDEMQAASAPIGAAFGALGSLAGSASSGGFGGLGGFGDFASKIGGLGSVGGV